MTDWGDVRTPGGPDGSPGAGDSNAESPTAPRGGEELAATAEPEEVGATSGPGEASRDEAAPEDVAPSGARAADVAELERQRDEYLEALRRLQADFENYKKRMVKQQTEHLERAAEALVTNLLPALDALDLAVAHSGSFEDSGSDALAQVASTFFDVLGKEGLERIDPQGEAFDPTVHDAVLHEAASDEESHEAPEVTEVLRPGYRWKRRVLRPAMVKVKG